MHIALGAQCARPQRQRSENPMCVRWLVAPCSWTCPSAPALVQHPVQTHWLRMSLTAGAHARVARAAKSRGLSALFASTTARPAAPRRSRQSLGRRRSRPSRGSQTSASLSAPSHLRVPVCSLMRSWPTSPSCLTRPTCLAARPSPSAPRPPVATSSSAPRCSLNRYVVSVLRSVPVLCNDALGQSRLPAQRSPNAGGYNAAC